MAFEDPFGGSAATPTPTPQADPLSVAPTAPAATQPAQAGGGGGFQDPFASAPSGGGGAAPAPSGGGKGPGGILGFFQQSASNVGQGLSTVGKALNAPEQLLFHGASALGSLFGGDVSGAAKTIGQTPGAITGNKADQMTFLSAMGQENAKLPVGVHNILNAAGSVAADPLNFLTLGMGPEARAAHEALAAAPGGLDISNAIRQGGLNALDQGTKDQIRQVLVNNAKDVVPEKAQSIADKGMQALEARGQGGLGLHVPGTDIGTHIAGSFDRPEVAQSVGDRFPKLAGMFSPDREAARMAADAAREDMATTATNVAKNAADHGSMQDVRPLFQKVQNAVRGQLLAFPGTVLNRARRGAEMLALDGAGERIPGLYKDAGEMMRGSKGALESVGMDADTIKSGIEKEMSKSENAAAAWDKARAQGVPATDELGRTVERPAVMDYPAARESYFNKLGTNTAQVKDLLDKAGVDGAHFLNIQQIVDGSGGNMFRDAQYLRDRVIPTGTGKASQAYEAATKAPRAAAGKIRQWGQAVETMNKVASAMHNLDRFGNVEQATAHVADVMGDPWKTTQFEKKISVVSPFWGAIRNHMESVARMGFDNPQRISILHHLLDDPHNPLGQGSGNPIGSTEKVLQAPLDIGTGLAGGVSSLVGGPKFGQGSLQAGMQGVAGLSAGLIPAIGRVTLGSSTLPKAPGKALVSVAKAAAPSVQRLPLPGKKTDLKSQIEKFLTGITGGAPTGG